MHPIGSQKEEEGEGIRTKGKEEKEGAEGQASRWRTESL